MELQVNGHATYCYTGGKPMVESQPTVVMIHGVLNDHSVWILQSRYLANHGWNVLAVDLPGHCRSLGEAPASVEAAADFIIALLDAAQVKRAALVGHSFGSLIALEAAARLKERVTHLALVGVAFPMKVSDVLLDAALNDPAKGIQMINVFSRSTLCAPPSALGPGTWVMGGNVALNQRVLKSNAQVNVFHRGFQACNTYANGEAAMSAVTCPVLFLLGAQDQMTPPSAARTLIDKAQARGAKTRTLQTQVVQVPVGHHQMTEAPEATLAALRDFLNARA
jgi:pimeloyl-ACP methyl ester carboxylesterase